MKPKVEVMTVRELKAFLNNFPDEAKVVFQSGMKSLGCLETYGVEEARIVLTEDEDFLTIDTAK